MASNLIYEVCVSRHVNADDNCIVMVRARSPKAAEAKALRIVKRDEDQWLGPVPTDTFIQVDEVERFEGEPDCVVY